MTNGKYTPVLIVLLIVASFFVGMYFTKATYLEKNLKDFDLNNNVRKTFQKPADEKQEQECSIELLQWGVP